MTIQLGSHVGSSAGQFPGRWLGGPRVARVFPMGGPLGRRCVQRLGP